MKPVVFLFLLLSTQKKHVVEMETFVFDVEGPVSTFSRIFVLVLFPPKGILNEIIWTRLNSGRPQKSCHCSLCSPFVFLGSFLEVACPLLVVVDGKSGIQKNTFLNCGAKISRCTTKVVVVHPMLRQLLEVMHFLFFSSLYLLGRELRSWGFGSTWNFSESQCVFYFRGCWETC